MKIPFPRLAIDARVEIGGVSHHYVERVTAGLTFRNDVTGAMATHEPKALVRAYVAGNFVMPPNLLPGLPVAVLEQLRYDLRELLPEKQAEAMRRHAFVAAFDRLSVERRPGLRRFSRIEADFKRVARVVAVLSRGKAPSWTALRDWYRRWVRSDRNPTALVRLDHKKGRKPEVFPPVVLDLVSKVAREHHLKAEGTSMEGLHVVVEGQLREYNERNGTSHDCPTARQLRTIVERLVTPAEKTRLVKGRRAARGIYDRKRRRPSPDRLLEVVEIDHVLLDVIATRERTGVPLETEEDAPLLKRGIAGRIWATVAICKRSRCIVGWSLSLDPPSYVSVMRCLRHVMTAKPDLVLDGLSVPNPCWGKPSVVHMDNGREFHSISLKVAAALLKIEIRHMGRAQPWERGRLERLFRDGHREVDNIPGKTFSDAKGRGDYDSVGMAFATVPEIERRFAVFAVGVHRHAEHRGLFRQTPAEAWDEAADLGVDYPPGPKAVELLTRKVLRRAQLRDVGIEHKGLFWSSAAFQDVLERNGLGKRYVVTVDPLDLTRATLIEETGQGPVFHEGELDRPELVAGLDLDMWERVWNRGRERTPAQERVRREILYRSRSELLSDARERDLAGERLPRVVAKFAEVAAREEAERRKAERAADAVTPVPTVGPPAPEPSPAPANFPFRTVPQPCEPASVEPARRSIAHRFFELA